jgi:hypothetical protein
MEGGSIMAFSPPDPVPARSLWLQLRSTKRKARRPQSHTDWNSLWFSLLLLSILALFYMIIPPKHAVEHPEQAAQKETVLQETSVLGSLAGP